MIKDLYELMQFPEQGIFSTVIAKSPNYNYTLMCLSKGTELEEHTSTKTAAISVLKGKGSIMITGKKNILQQGLFIMMQPNSPHSLKADEDLAILVLLTS